MPIPSHKIYFAGAIRGGRDDAEIYLAIIKQLNQYGEVLTEHVGDPELSSFGEAGRDREIHDRDLKWLAASDYLVADVTTPSLGVGYEIGRACEWNKAVPCLYRPRDDRSLSAMIAGAREVTVREYESTAELDEIFREFFGA